jgi:hypothetical protein
LSKDGFGIILIGLLRKLTISANSKKGCVEFNKLSWLR